MERLNRTIKRNMWKYFSGNNAMNYIDILQNLIKKYNNTFHRSIKCTPAFAISPSSYQHVYDTLHTRREDDVEVKPKFKIGDRVRILKKKKTFEKGFTPNWTEELFIVSDARLTKPVTYNFKDLKGETIKGAFYQQELQKANQEVYHIHKVLRKRKRKGGTKEAQVKWKGYSNDFNSWIPESDIQKMHISNAYTWKTHGCSKCYDNPLPPRNIRD